MEKILKTNVYYNDTVFCENGEVAIDVDFTLPDYCPDISKIFKCVLLPRISSKGINGKTITVDGVAELTVFYCDDEGRFSSFCYQYPIEKSFEMKEEVTGAFIKAKISNDYINCRAVSGRKIDIHGACSLKVKVVKRKCGEVLSDFEDDNIEVKRGTAKATVPMGCAEKYLMLEEELKIAESKAPIKNIIRNNVTAVVKETKVISGKVMVKGECRISILYCSENSENPESMKTVIPYSQIIDVEDVTDACSADAVVSIAFCDIKPKTSVLGENRSFAITVKLEICANAFCDDDIALIEDAFSRKYEAEICKDKIAFEKIVKSIAETHHFKGNIKLDKSISSVIDVSSSIVGITAKFEDKNFVISANLVVGCVILTEENKVIYEERSLEFVYKNPVDKEIISPYCDPILDIEGLSYTILSADTIEIRADVSIEACIYEKRQIDLISDLKIDETKLHTRSKRNAMTIYFPNSDERVWDIARIYNASVEEIMRINEIENEDLPLGKMLLVPVM